MTPRAGAVQDRLVTGPTGASSQTSMPIRELVRLQPRGALLGLLMGLGTATQLRSAGSAGFSEVLIVALIGAVLPGQWPQFRSLTTLPGRVLVLFIVAASAGGLVDVIRGGDSLLATPLGLLPYFFALLCIEFVLASHDSKQLLLTWAQVFGVVVLSSQLLLLLAFLSGFDTLGPFDLIVGDRNRNWRFTGWSANPNQLAMTAVLSGGVLALATTSRKVKVLAIGGAVVLGVASGSDGFLVGLAASTAAVLVLGGIGRSPSGPLRLGLMVASPCIALASIIVIPLAMDTASQRAQDKGQADERIELWTSCLPSVVDSPVVGLGMTPQGSLGDETDRSCHNTYVEIAAKAGAPTALVVLYVLPFRLLFGQWSRGSLVGVWLVVQASTQMVFSFFFRYPYLWLAILLLDSLASRRPEEPEKPEEPEDHRPEPRPKAEPKIKDMQAPRGSYFDQPGSRTSEMEVVR